MSGTKWTDEEVGLLKLNFASNDKDNLIDLFNRNWSAIKCKAHELGLKRAYVYLPSPKKIDFTDKVFDLLTAKEFLYIKNRASFWRFDCVCGNTVTRSISQVKYNLKSGYCVSCGCGRKENILKVTYGNLVPVSFSHTSNRGAWWNTKCSLCNNIKLMLASSIKKSHSCGCDNGYNRISSNNYNWKGYKLLTGTFWSSIKSGAKNRNLKFEIDKKYAYSILEKQHFRCALSNVPIFLDGSQKSYNNNCDLRTASLDRINSKEGYTQNNIQWIHKDVNMMKQDNTDEDFIKWSYIISDYQRSKEAKSLLTENPASAIMEPETCVNTIN